MNARDVNGNRMSFGIVKEVNVWWRVNVGGDSTVCRTKAEAEERLRTDINKVKEWVALLQRRVARAKKNCSFSFRKYKDFLVNKDRIVVNVYKVSVDSSNVSWNIPKTDCVELRYQCHINLPDEFLRAIPEHLLNEYMRHWCKYQLEREVANLKEKKKEYYEAVKLEKEVRNFKFDKEEGEK